MSKHKDELIKTGALMVPTSIRCVIKWNHIYWSATGCGDTSYNCKASLEPAAQMTLIQQFRTHIYIGLHIKGVFICIVMSGQMTIVWASPIHVENANNSQWHKWHQFSHFSHFGHVHIVLDITGILTWNLISGQNDKCESISHLCSKRYKKNINKIIETATL